MDSIISDLYMGELRPFERHTPHEEAYRAASASYDEAEQALLEGLSGDQRRLLRRLSEAHRDALYLLELDAFTLGFQLGGRMAAEMLG